MIHFCLIVEMNKHEKRQIEWMQIQFLILMPNQLAERIVEVAFLLNTQFFKAKI